MVFKIFKRKKTYDHDPLNKWEKQVKNSQRIRKDQLDRFVSSSGINVDSPSYCDPSFLEDRLETNQHRNDRSIQNNVDEKYNEKILHDSSDTRQVHNLDPTVTEEERFSIHNQTDEYYTSNTYSHEFGYNDQSAYDDSLVTYTRKPRMNNASEDGDELGSDGAAIYLYNELLSNRVLTCMTLPIIPCLGIYVKKIQSDAAQGKKLRGEDSEDMGRTNFSISQDDDESPIYSTFGRTSEDNASLDAEPTSPYGPGITNYSMESPSTDINWPRSGEENYNIAQDYDNEHYGTAMRYDPRMQTKHANALMHHDGSYTQRNLRQR